MKMLKVVYVEPHKRAVVAEIEDSLAGIQKAVDGYFETVDMCDGCVLVCNEEAKLRGMDGNRRYNGGRSVIAGPFFVAGLGEEDFRSLTDEETERYLNRFAEPEEIPKEEVEADMGFQFIVLP